MHIIQKEYQILWGHILKLLFCEHTLVFLFHNDLEIGVRVWI
jgi:hypothetical protein